MLLIRAPLASLSLAGQEHGRTIPLADMMHLSVQPSGSSVFVLSRMTRASKEGVPHMPNQRARREEQKFSLSARKPTEGS